MFKMKLAALSLALIGSQALAQGINLPGAGNDNANGNSNSNGNGNGNAYEVTITNLTPGQYFTPQLLVTHPSTARLFQTGEMASYELEQLAEGGDTGPLTDLVANVAADALTVDGLLGPGETTSATIMAMGNSRYLSMAAMLLPTNDTFVGVNSLALPSSGSATYMAVAYDAGTEENDQLCANIPGPMCGGAAGSDPAEGDEGFVHVSNGFHELGGDALSPAAYDWRNPVARVVVKRVN